MKEGKLANLALMIQPVFTPELKSSFLQMSLYYLMSSIAQQSLQSSLMQCFSAVQGEFTQRFRDTLKETSTQFMQNYDELILRFTGIQSLFAPEEQYPILLMAILSSVNKTRDLADLSIRSVFSAIDTKDESVSEKVFRMIFNEMYFFKDFSEREDQQTQMLPIPHQIKLIENLLKFECSASQTPFNLKLINHCIFTILAPQLQKSGLEFMNHMIRFDDMKNFSTVSYLKQSIHKILNDPNFSEDSQSMSLQLLANLGIKTYDAINDDIEVSILLFERLKERIQHLKEDGIVAVRSDFIALNYIEALNKLRDCYSQHLTDASKRSLLLNQVLNFLNKESQKAHNEINYLYFLFLTRLDQGALSSSVLLYSIIFKEHEDIKIKKEAQYLLDKFNSDKNSQKRILRSFLKDIEAYLQRTQQNYLQDGQDEELESYLKYNNIQFLPADMERMMELTQFALRFYKEEQLNKEELMDLEDQNEIQRKVERMMLMNLNLNYQQIKSDFSNQLEMIHDYLTIAKPIGVLNDFGLGMIFKLSQGQTNLPQRVLSLKIVIKILRIQSETGSINEKFYHQITQAHPQKEKSIESLSHENKLNLLYQTTVILLKGDSQDPQYIIELVNCILFGPSLSPNIIEQTKLLLVCLKKLGERVDLTQKILNSELFVKIADKIHELIKRSELDLVFRKYIILNGAGLFKKAQKEIKLEKAQQLLKSMIGLDNVDIQDSFSQTLAKIFYHIDEVQFLALTEEMMSKIFTKSTEEITLVVKRNCAIYLYAVVNQYGKDSQSIQERFIQIQKVFLKFLFDRKSFMQDLSSKALSKIYHLGTPEVRDLLIDALSKTLSGEKSASEHQEKDENQELLLEFKDNTSTEQRDKLKTYKDLCNIAVELGHRELIYQFLEVHRHLAQYQDIKNAAKGLSTIIMLDDRLKRDLLKIAPKILLLTYDHNNEVNETMKQLWSNLIEIEKEDQIINDRWAEIFKEALAGLTSNEYRRRQSSALALSDLLGQREWGQIKDQFRELFLTSLGLLDDQKDSVKIAAFQLIKTVKRVTLKLGNIYTNSNVQELEEVLAIVIPMLLNETMKSNIKQVKFFSFDLLFELVKTTQNHQMMTKLKFQNKYEKQLVFNYNSEQKMKEIINQYLDKIVLEILGTISQMNKAVESINQFEQYAISQGMSSSSASQSKSQVGISEGDLNDLRQKFTKESTRGEILKICRDQMTEPTFVRILNDLINLMRTGHDVTTKSSAIQFVQDIVLENKGYLITPQNSKRIAQKLVEIYTLNSVSASLQIKDSIRLLYAQCLGLQIKLMREYPKTIQQIVDSIVALPKELTPIICLNIYEIAKNLSEDMIKEDSGKIFKATIPMFYINRYQQTDSSLKNLCRKAYSYLQDIIPELTEHNQQDIFKSIKEMLDSSSYDERVAASIAMQELVQKLSDEDVRNSPIVSEVTDKLHLLIAGKYFNNKQTVVEGFMSLLKLNTQLQGDAAFMNTIVHTLITQIEKYSQSQLDYKNQVIKSLTQTLNLSKFISEENKQAIFELLIGEVQVNLMKVSEKASMIETMDEFEEKREEEKQTLQTAVFSLETLPLTISNDKQVFALSDVCQKYYQKTNWIVRNAILKSLLAQLNKLDESIIMPAIDLVCFIIKTISDMGEKYDLNLSVISDLVLLFTERHFKKLGQSKDEIASHIMNVLKLINEKGQESLKKNSDLIKHNIGYD